MHKEEGSTLLTVLFIMLITSIMLVSMYSATFTNTSTVNATISHSQALMNARSGLEMTYQEFNKAWNTTWNSVSSTISQGGSIALTTAEATLSQFVTTETAQLTTANSAFTVSVTSGTNDLTSATESTGLYQDFNVSVTGISGQNSAVLNDTFVISGTIPALNYVAYTPGNLVIAGSPSLQGDVYVGNSLYLDTNPWFATENPYFNSPSSYIQPLDPTKTSNPFKLDKYLNNNNYQTIPTMSYYFLREPLYYLENNTTNKFNLIGHLSVKNSISRFNGISNNFDFGNAGDPSYSNYNFLTYNGNSPLVLWNNSTSISSFLLSPYVQGNPNWTNFKQINSISILTLIMNAFKNEISFQKASFNYNSDLQRFVENPNSLSSNNIIFVSSNESNLNTNVFSLVEDPNVTSVEIDPNSNVIYIPSTGLQQPLYVQGDLVIPTYIDNQKNSLSNMINDGQPIYVDGDFLLRGNIQPLQNTTYQGTIYTTGNATIANIPSGTKSRLEIYAKKSISITTLQTSNSGAMDNIPFILNAYLASSSNIYLGGMSTNIILNGGLVAQNIILNSTLGNQTMVSDNSGKYFLLQWTGGNYQRLSIIYNNSYITHPLTGSSIIANLQVQPLQQPTYQ